MGAIVNCLIAALIITLQPVEEPELRSLGHNQYEASNPSAELIRMVVNCGSRWKPASVDLKPHTKSIVSFKTDDDDEKPVCTLTYWFSPS